MSICLYFGGCIQMLTAFIKQTGFYKIRPILKENNIIMCLLSYWFVNLRRWYCFSMLRVSVVY